MSSPPLPPEVPSGGAAAATMTTAGPSPSDHTAEPAPGQISNTDSSQPVKRNSSTTVRIRRRKRPSNPAESSSSSPMARQAFLNTSRPRRSTQGVSYVESSDDDEVADLPSISDGADSSSSAQGGVPTTSKAATSSLDSVRSSQETTTTTSPLSNFPFGAGGGSVPPSASVATTTSGSIQPRLTTPAAVDKSQPSTSSVPATALQTIAASAARTSPPSHIDSSTWLPAPAHQDPYRSQYGVDLVGAAASALAYRSVDVAAVLAAAKQAASASSPASASASPSASTSSLPLKPTAPAPQPRPYEQRADRLAPLGISPRTEKPSVSAPGASVSPEAKATGPSASTSKGVLSHTGNNGSTPSIGRMSAAASSSAIAQSGPHKSPARGRPRKRQQTLITSRSFVPNPTSSNDDVNFKPAKEGGMKRVDRRYKADSGTPDRLSGAASAPVALLTTPPDPARHPSRRAQQLSSTDPIPLETAQTPQSVLSKPLIPTYASSPRHPPPRTRPRLFGLEEAPTFYPTWEEFANPMQYIAWVGSPEGGNGKQYGIVKVVPPEGWHMDCVLDQSKFRFRTRVQQLNSLTADARANQNYQEQLQKFHSQQGSPRVSIPIIDRRPVNLYQLKLVVKEAGGYDRVSKGRRWTEIARVLGYPDNLAAHVSPQVKAAYIKIILPFEDFLARARDQTKGPNGSTLDESVSSNDQSVAAPAADEITQELLAAGLSAEEVAQAQLVSAAGVSKRRSSRKRMDNQPIGKRDMAGNSGRSFKGRRYTRQDSEIDPEDLVTVNGAEEQMCEICLRGDNGMAMLLCDECNRGYHMYCLDPPLATVPKSQWFCPPCLVGTGNDYGFDDGETHSLDSFWKRSDAFRRNWFKERPNAIWKGDLDTPAGTAGEALKRDGEDVTMRSLSSQQSPPDNGMCRPIAGTDLRVSEDDVEREFWRSVESIDETVEVEYGADVHSTTHGSASPTLETHPLNSYSRDGWNLNNLPILPNSLLRYIKSDISGMTVPWIYVGMMFSTFCWHNEDHYTYSVNYQHWGDTKTWYGIPGAAASEFEEAMRRAAPDLFETSPDLLFQLVTMISPSKLSKEGVKVYACDQRANEFVITYPKAYHSGFNHGFNLNEAVNFALPDWINFDLEAVLRYQKFSRAPVFSHDELLITATQHNTSLEAAMWLQAPLKEMVDRELRLRNALRETVSGLTEIIEERDRTEEAEYQCSQCKCFCYLAQIIAPSVDGVACLEHAFEVFGTDSPKTWTLRIRYSDIELENISERISDRADHPTQWQKRFRKLLLSHARPPLRSLRSLLQEGERIGLPMPEVEQLKDFVAAANEWVQNAAKFMPKRYGGRPVASNNRKRRSGIASQSPTPLQDSVGLEETGRNELRTLEALYGLLAQVDQMPFDAPEIAVLRDAVVMAQKSEHICSSVLKRIEDGEEVSLDECERVLLSCEGVNVDVEQYSALKAYSLSRKWTEELDGIWDNHINYQEVQEFLREFAATRLPDDHHYHKGLQGRLAKGDEWKKEAEAVLSGEAERTVERLTRLTSTEETIPVVPDMHVELENLLKIGKDCVRTITAIFQATANHQGREQELSDARKVLRTIHSAKLNIDLAVQLQQDVNLHDDWRSKMLEAVSTVYPKADTVLSDKHIKDAVDAFSRRAHRGAQMTDEQIKDNRDGPTLEHWCFCGDRALVPGVKQTDRVIQCQDCKRCYHDLCARPVHPDDEEHGQRAAKDCRVPMGNVLKWKCVLCRPAGLPHFLESRHAMAMNFLSDLFSANSSKEMRFLPSEFELMQNALHDAKKHYENVKLLLSKLLPTWKDARGYAHLLHGLFITPVDFDAGSEASPINQCVSALFSAAGLDSAGKPIRGRPTVPVAALTSLSATPTREISIVGDGVSSMAFDQGEGDQSVDMSQPPPGGYSTAQLTHPSGSNASPPAPPGGDQKRKRGKRAKFVFREEVGIWVPVQGERIYCLCHRKETGDMICCDRCMLWFHNDCVHIPLNFGDPKWHCPMCCIKTEKKYPYAEVKVKEMGVTHPDKWLDVRASLRSTQRPISKLQNWSMPPEKRIVLHLDSFYPAIHAEITGLEQAKRIRFEDAPNAGSSSGPIAPQSSGADALSMSHLQSGGKEAPIVLGEDDDDLMESHPKSAAAPKLASVVARPIAPLPVAHAPRLPSSSAQQGQIGDATARMHAAETDEERYQAGMANLRARGVSDAMINRYAVGWNGRTLVYPRYDPDNPAAELDLGPTIQLAPNDPDGTILIRSAKARRLQHDLAAGVPRPPGMGFGPHPALHHPMATAVPPVQRQPFGQPHWATKQTPSTYGGFHQSHRSPEAWHDPYYGYKSSPPASMRLPEATLPSHNAPRSPALPAMSSTSPTPSQQWALQSENPQTHHQPAHSSIPHLPPVASRPTGASGYTESYSSPAMYQRVPLENAQAPRSPAISTSQPNLPSRLSAPPSRMSMTPVGVDAIPKQGHPYQAHASASGDHVNDGASVANGGGSASGILPAVPSSAQQPSPMQMTSTPSLAASAPAPAAGHEPARTTPIAGGASSASPPPPPPPPPLLNPGASENARDVYRNMAKRMRPDADDAELESMVDRMFGQ